MASTTLLVCVIASVVVVMLESVAAVALWAALARARWITGIFTVSALRLYCVTKPLRYVISFFGLVDLMAVLPATSACCCPARRTCS